MQQGFGERIDLLLQKSVRAASRLVKERQKEARERGMHQEPSSVEVVNALVNELMENGKSSDLDRVRNLRMKELFEETWSQMLRNYEIHRRIKDACDAF